MIKALLLDRKGNPLKGATIMLVSIPYEGMVQEIAVITNDNGIVSIDCKSVKGTYIFNVYLDNGESAIIKVKNKSTDPNNILVLKM